MLRQLSGKTHLVITGVCLTSRNKQVSFSDTTKVTFAELSDDEIEYYSRHYNPTDKAGAYGIQEWIGFIGVESIEGSYFNVMGLPIRKVYKGIEEF
jgi:septum formation protein